MSERVTDEQAAEWRDFGYHGSFDPQFRRAQNTIRALLDDREDRKAEVERLRGENRESAESVGRDYAEIKRLHGKVERLRAERRCGCAWCCMSTPPEQRGDAHKRTCRALEGTSDE